MEKKITVSRKKAKKLTVSRKKAKILTVNRKSPYPIETLSIVRPQMTTFQLSRTSSETKLSALSSDILKTCL